MNYEERIAELQKQIDKLKEEMKNQFKRVDKGEFYYTVVIDCGKATIISTYDNRDNYYDDTRLKNNNYFLTKERAKEVAEKINALLKFERIHDTLCPEYKPDWNDETVVKCSIMTYASQGEMFKGSCYGIKSDVATYFPEDKIEEAFKLYKEMP